jgi:hypothetical protein
MSKAKSEEERLMTHARLTSKILVARPAINIRMALEIMRGEVVEPL